ncbi:hypothetical protein ACT4R0_03045 [Ornithobacterium rhinotracheale]|uniref:hypothetical protein n=1 Tax=Ornithobacterium rhinotracheale TaxID=28251 RepID=UPI0040364CAB
MRILLNLFLFLIAISVHAQVYISEKTNGHKADFLIIENDSLILENHTVRFKVSNTPMLRLEKYKILDKTNNILKTKKFNALVEPEYISINGIKYFKKLEIPYSGDFHRIDKSFGNTTNDSRLKSCRDFYKNQKDKL